MVRLWVRFSKFGDIWGLGFTSSPKIHNFVSICASSPLRNPKPHSGVTGRVYKGNPPPPPHKYVGEPSEKTQSNLNPLGLDRMGQCSRTTHPPHCLCKYQAKP